MTPAERQRRRRERLRKERDKAVVAGKRAAARDKAHATYIPAPPGITYWRKVTVTAEVGTHEIWTPVTRPIALIDRQALSDDDVVYLLGVLNVIAAERGLATELGLTQ